MPAPHNDTQKYIDNAPVGFFITNEKEQYIKVNQAACQITGFSEQELLAMSVKDMVPKEFLEITLQSLQEVDLKGKVRVESKFLKKDGSQGWWIVNAVKLSEKETIAYTTDITKTKQVEIQLKQKVEEMERSNKLMIGRELQMVELKKEINNLKQQLAQKKE